MNVTSATSSLRTPRHEASTSTSTSTSSTSSTSTSSSSGASGATPTRVDAFDGRVPTEAERNRKAVDDFYKAFARKDGAAMTAAYAPNATFSDKVFPSLKGKEPGAMWRMLCESDTLNVRHEIIKAEGDTVTAKWIAKYEFNGRPIENHVTATIKMKDGKIVDHKDDFDMKKWLSQAYGMAAKLPFAEHILGGITRHVAGAKLDSFIAAGK